ncbi:MAG: hypothetical protein QXZ09_01780 [Candidatus Methanomethylicaceae archaeon]
MQVTLVAPVAILITLALSLRPGWLTSIAKAAVFSLPFGGIALVNFHDVPPYFGVGLDRYFCGLLILAGLGGAKRSVSTPRGLLFPASVWPFLGAVLLSLGGAILLSDRQVVAFTFEPVSMFYETEVHLGAQNLIKTVELLLHLAVFSAFVRILPRTGFYTAARIYVASCTVLALSAVLDVLFPMGAVWAFLKNNISYSNAAGVIEGWFGEPRASGLAVEPSHVPIYCMGGICVLLGFWTRGIHLYTSKIDALVAITLVAAAFLSFSPSLLAGLACMCAFILGRFRKVKWRPVVALLVTLVALSWLISHSLGISYRRIIVNTLLGKLGFSVEEGPYSEFRKMSAEAMVQAFSYSPVIGIGWGTVLHQVGWPLLLLAWTGLVGLGSFMIFLYACVRNALKEFRNLSDARALAAKGGFLMACITLLVMTFPTKGPYLFFQMNSMFLLASSYGPLLRRRSSPAPERSHGGGDFTTEQLFR